MALARNCAIGVTALACGFLWGCGGGTANSGSTPAASAVSAQVSGTSPLSATCGGTVPTGTGETFTTGSGIQPQTAVVPGAAVVGVWEQDRWTGLGSRAILAARSTDGGSTWSTPIVLPFSACGGGAGVGSGYDRASDPWVAFAGSGVVIASALAFSANGFVENSFVGTGGTSAVLVSRSTDGGATWSTPTALIRDNPGATAYFDDRDSIAADSSGNVYVVWDRLSNAVTNGVPNSIPAYLASSTDGGVSWSASRVLYDPGAGNQTFNNEVAILPSGVLLDFFTLISLTSSVTSLQVVRSADQGKTWSTTPVTVASITSVGTPDPIAGGPPIRGSMLLAQVAVDPASGAVAAVWQQSFSGATFDGIALSVSKDGGATWSTPTQINGAPAVAAFSPTVRYLPGSVLAVSYYDFRDYASGSSVLSTDAWLSESADGGTTWHELRLQSAFDLTKAPLAFDSQVGFGGTGLFLGDNQGLALVGANPLPLYAAASSAGAHVYATQSPNPINSTTAHVYKAL